MVDTSHAAVAVIVAFLTSWAHQLHGWLWPDVSAAEVLAQSCIAHLAGRPSETRHTTWALPLFVWVVIGALLREATSVFLERFAVRVQIRDLAETGQVLDQVAEYTDGVYVDTLHEDWTDYQPTR